MSDLIGNFSMVWVKGKKYLLGAELAADIKELQADNSQLRILLTNASKKIQQMNVFQSDNEPEYE